MERADSMRYNDTKIIHGGSTEKYLKQQSFGARGCIAGYNDPDRKHVCRKYGHIRDSQYAIISIVVSTRMTTVILFYFSLSIDVFVTLIIAMTS